MLRITEIFYSLQGESHTVGLPTVFVRLTGCPLRCQYCDTTYAFKGGNLMSLPEILNTIKQYKTSYVTVTGGEPLAQKECIALLKMLCDANYNVSLETSGALSVADVDSRVSKVMDLKTPGSQEVMRNDYKNIDYLNAHDQVKIVICHEEDYLWAKEIITKYQITSRCQVFFSPSYQQLDNSELADWMLRDQLDVRFQLQLHKVIWGDVPGR